MTRRLLLPGSRLLYNPYFSVGFRQFGGSDPKSSKDLWVLMTLRARSGASTLVKTPRPVEFPQEDDEFWIRNMAKLSLAWRAIVEKECLLCRGCAKAAFSVLCSV